MTKPDPALSAAEHYLRATAALAAASDPAVVRRGQTVVSRYLALADVHARLAALPESLADEAAALYADRVAEAAAEAEAKDAEREAEPAEWLVTPS